MVPKKSNGTKRKTHKSRNTQFCFCALFDLILSPWFVLDWPPSNQQQQQNQGRNYNLKTFLILFQNKIPLSSSLLSLCFTVNIKQNKKEEEVNNNNKKSLIKINFPISFLFSSLPPPPLSPHQHHHHHHSLFFLSLSLPPFFLFVNYK